MNNIIPSSIKKYAHSYNTKENKVKFETTGETLTQEHFQDQQEISNIIRAFTKGLPVTINQLQPTYEDVTEIQDFQRNFETLKKAEIIKKEIDENIKTALKEKQEKEQNELNTKLEKLKKYEDEENNKKEKTN